MLKETRCHRLLKPAQLSYAAKFCGRPLGHSGQCVSDEALAKQARKRKDDREQGKSLRPDA